MPEPSSRRVFPRTRQQIPAWYDFGGTFQRGVALDLGVGGAQLVTAHSLQGVQELEVNFQLSDDWTVAALARPLWEKPHGDGYLVGVTYRPLRSADKHLIGPWVHRQRRSQEPS